MVIDFHTHVWPDKIARATVNKLKQMGNIPAYSDGTVSGLITSMKAARVDLSIILPVVTRPEQFDTINRFAVKMNEQEGVMSFGGIHPKNIDVEEKLEFIKSLGLKGIKLHPAYQETYIDEEPYQRIIDYALKIGLIVSVHAGLDVGLPDPIYCTPDRICKLYERLGLDKQEENKLIFAHTGGYACWKEVYEQLAGKKIYFDCSTTLGIIEDALFVQIVRRHGTNRIVFGSDFPWKPQKEMIDYLNKIGLTEGETEDIMWRTAKKLLEEI